MKKAARALNVSPSDVESALFGDLKTERRVAALPEDLGPARLAVEANLSIVGSLLRRAAPSANVT